MMLKGNGFILRELNLNDPESMSMHANNINVSGFLFNRFPSPYTLRDAEEFINMQIGKAPVTVFAIEIEKRLCGVIGLDFRADVYFKAPLLGYWLSEQCWGKGIMTEAVRLITAYAFDNLDIVRIQALVFGNNPRSMRVLQKAGFQQEGILRKNIFKNNEVLDEYIFGLIK